LTGSSRRAARWATNQAAGPTPAAPPPPATASGTRAPIPIAPPPAAAPPTRSLSHCAAAPQFNAAIETHDGLRGVYATKDIPALGLIAKIPLSAALWMPLQLKNITQQGAHLAKEAAKGASSAYAPYLEALPSLKDPHHTVNYYTFPKDYLPHVDAEPIVSFLASARAVLPA
jgi:hypothetical protein